MKAVVIHAARDLRVEEREPETPGRGFKIKTGLIEKLTVRKETLKA